MCESKEIGIGLDNTGQTKVVVRLVTTHKNAVKCILSAQHELNAILDDFLNPPFKEEEPVEGDYFDDNGHTGE